MNVTADGTGVAFGKMAESNNTLESRWPIITGSRFGCSGAYGDQNFNIYCQWADGANHDMLVRNTDGVSMGLGWVGNDTHQTTLDIRPKKVKIRGETTVQGFRVPEIQHGRVSITPSAANTPTTKIVTFGQTFSNTPNVTATPISGVPGTTVLGVSILDPSTTQVSICLTRTNTTTTKVDWIAVN
jgi:hypothetical protein